jgi:hypothetical protein
MAISLEKRRKAIEIDIAQRKLQLAEQEKELIHLQILIPQLKAAIANHESILTTVIQEIEAEQKPQTSGATVHRNPMDMLRPEYKGMKLGDIATHVLESCHAPLTTTDLAHRIYEAKTNDELSRARNSLSAELRTGMKDAHPRWQKIGRNAYASLQYSQEEAA